MPNPSLSGMARRSARKNSYDDFMREIIIMKKLNHPNVVRLFEVRPPGFLPSPDRQRCRTAAGRRARKICPGSVGARLASLFIASQCSLASGDG
jgi:serine/threonine protein kinase